jgi:hypothetical protein
MNQLIDDRIVHRFRQTLAACRPSRDLNLLQGVKALLGATRVSRSFKKLSLRHFQALALIFTITLSAIPTAVAQQDQNYTLGGKINQQFVLSSGIRGYLGSKFKSGADVPSGRFRVTLIGFVCNHETRDDTLAYDGLADEIRLRAETRVVDRDGELLLTGSAESRVMGSINRDDWRRTRVQAGTADPFGGIRTGDSIPSRPAYNWRYDRKSDTPANPELPFLLFEGDLIQGENAVVIVPTIWEIDDGAGLFPRFQHWVSDIAPALIRYGATAAAGPATGKAAGRAADAVFEATDHLLDGIRGGDGGDRVIGIQGKGDNGFFNPTLIRLNYGIAEAALGYRFPGPLDMPPGVIPINYRDAGDLNGDYTLFIKIERLKSINNPG